MKREIYASWCAELANSEEALRILKQSPFLAGIESSQYGEDEKKFQKAGLKLSIHNPNRFLKLDLSDNNLVDALTSKKNMHLLDAIIKENAQVVGFHAIHKIFLLHKKMVFEQGECDSGYELGLLGTDETVMTSNIINNLLKLDELINKGKPLNEKVKILFETSPFYDPRIIRKGDFSSEREKILTRLLDYFTSPDFIKKVLEHPEIKANESFGMLFDVSHVFITANTKRINREFKGREKDYVNEMINACKGRTYQVHVNVPEGSVEKGLIDKHNPITLREQKSDMVIGFTKELLRHNPELRIITLEMEADHDPVSHAKILAEQAQLMARELKLIK